MPRAHLAGISGTTLFVREWCLAPYTGSCTAPYPIFSAGEAILMILIDVVLYGFLAWWLEQVWQGDYGQAKPLLFFLDPSFMCPRRRGGERAEGDLAMSLRGLRKVFKSKVAVDGIETQHKTRKPPISPILILTNYIELYNVS